ncbi:4-carboxymuconolactone decarboxylase [Desulfocarbo indianensis]|nr:4-carboxymuconolactone decarboxylase [Desulfocarbo indianensis]
MSDDLKAKTAATAETLFAGYKGERPYELWRAFDKGLAKDMSLYITGQMYAREKLPHPTRQLVAIASLASLGHVDELRLHVYAGLQVGLKPEEVAEAIFQVGTYAGVPRVNQALAVLKEVLEARGQWPLGG